MEEEGGCGNWRKKKGIRKDDRKKVLGCLGFVLAILSIIGLIIGFSDSEAESEEKSQKDIVVTASEPESPISKPWLNGDYKVGFSFALVHLNEDEATFQQLKFLDSEDNAMHEMSIALQKGDNARIINITLDGESAPGEISDDKKTITGGPGVLSFPKMSLQWISPEEANTIRNRQKQSVAAPEVPYPLRPGELGNIVFISGPPGSGKSTIAGIIANTDNWIHYEGDGFYLGFNPYVFPNESQVEARSDKPSLIGPGMRKRMMALLKSLKNHHELEQNITTDRTPIDNYYTLMAENIKSERKRVGGDWIISFAIEKRMDRDIFRKVIGDDLIFVVLDISKELQIERLQGRGEGEEDLAKSYEKYERAEPEEPKTIGFLIEKGKSKEENANAVKELILAPDEEGST